MSEWRDAPLGRGFAVWLLPKMWTVCLVCTSLVMNASRCQPDHTAQKPRHTPLAPASVPAFCLYAHAAILLPTNKILSFPSQMQTRSYTIVDSLPLQLACAGHTWQTNGLRGGKSAFSLSLYFSVCTSLRGLNEITVIQLDQRGEEIQMLFSSSPAGVSTSLSPLYPLWIVSPSLPSLFPSLLLIYVHNKKKKSRIESTFQSIQSQFNVEQSMSV